MFTKLLLKTIFEIAYEFYVATFKAIDGKNIAVVVCHTAVLNLVSVVRTQNRSFTCNQ